MSETTRVMRERELRAAAECAACRRKIGAAGVPVFCRVAVWQFAIDPQAIMEQDGLTQMLRGEARLAQILGPDRVMAQAIAPPVEITLCAECATKRSIAAYEILATREQEGD